MAVGAALKIGASFVGLDDLARIRNRMRKIGRDLRILDAATRGAGHNSGGAEIVVVLVVEGMARQTPHRLDGVKQFTGDRTVGRVTRKAILDHRGVLENPGADNVLVALCAELVAGAVGHPRILVGVVATGAAHAPFSHGMMRGEIELGRDIAMALDTETRLGVHISGTRLRKDAQMRSVGVVGVVAIGTVEPRSRMFAGSPLEVGVVPDRVTQEAIGVGRVPDLERIFAIGVQAPSAVTALAVGVVGGNAPVPLDILVAYPALGGTDAFGSRDRLGAMQISGLPFEGRAGAKAQQHEKNPGAPGHVHVEWPRSSRRACAALEPESTRPFARTPQR